MQRLDNDNDYEGEEEGEEEMEQEQEEQVEEVKVVEHKFKKQLNDDDKQFAKIVRNLDREQAIKNENQRYAYFERREEELEKQYDKIYKKMLFQAGLTEKSDKKKVEEVYDEAMELMTEQITKEWRRKGKTDRDWIKMKILVFDENNILRVKSIDQNKKEEKEEELLNSQVMKPTSKKLLDKQFAQVQEVVKQALKKFDDKENEEVETDCSICFNIMTESCLLPCRHRFCIQCMREHMSYQKNCPICRKDVPSYFKCKYYQANVDPEFKQVIKKKFPLEYELNLLNLMHEGVKDIYQMSFEVGQYYMGYENPANVYDYDQKVKTSEWTVFIRAQNPALRPYISQFISKVDFQIPKQTRPITVEAPTASENNIQESKALYQIQTKINRNKFKLDAENKVIMLGVTIWFNNNLSSKNAPLRPFNFQMELNFGTIEKCKPFIITFDGNRVQKVIKLQDFQSSLIKNNVKDLTNLDEVKKAQKNDHQVRNV